MKFDLHNLPFLAGGLDWNDVVGPRLTSGFCPGLYFVKKGIVLNKWTETLDPDAVSSSWQNPDKPEETLVAWILSQPEPKEYVEPFCLVNQKLRYPDQDCCGDNTAQISLGDGYVYVDDFLNTTWRCTDHCEDCNYVPDRWSENQFQLFCPATPS